MYCREALFFGIYHEEAGLVFFRALQSGALPLFLPLFQGIKYIP